MTLYFSDRVFHFVATVFMYQSALIAESLLTFVDFQADKHATYLSTFKESRLWGDMSSDIGRCKTWRNCYYQKKRMGCEESSYFMVWEALARHSCLLPMLGNTETSTLPYSGSMNRRAEVFNKVSQGLRASYRKIRSQNLPGVAPSKEMNSRIKSFTRSWNDSAETGTANCC